MNKLKLGDEVVDRLSGFRGHAAARTMWLNGCERIGIQPKIDKDGKLPEIEWFDDEQVELFVEEKTDEEQPDRNEPEARQSSGGPQSDPKRSW